jgi:predicted dehydrogenase
MTLKIAIVGCGKIADGHIEEIQKMPAAATVVAVADLEILMAEQIAVRYGVARPYDDLDALLRAEKPDVVHITTPPGSHLPLAMKALDAGAHVYVEKPLTLRYADAKLLIEHAVRARKKLTIGYSYLFDPPALAMREMIARGVLGAPVHVESFYGYNLAGPFGSAILGDGAHWVHRLPGKLFHNNIDHILYKLPEFLPDDRSDEAFAADPLGGLAVTATGYLRRERRFGDARDEMLDELRFTITGSSMGLRPAGPGSAPYPGGPASVYGTFSSHIKPTGHFARVYGTKNTLHVDYANRSVTMDAQTTLPSAIGRLVPAFDQGLQYLRAGGKNLLRFAQSDFHYFSGLNRLIAMFYESIVSDGPPPIPYRDILRISALIDEIFRQVPQGRSPA